MKRRVALITESQARQNTPMPAYQYYQSPRSRWINTVIHYMEARDFNRKDAYFLSYHDNRVIGFEDTLENYPVYKWHPRKVVCELFAKKIVEFLIQRYSDEIFVELHLGKTLAEPLILVLDSLGISYRVYADGVPLGAKPGYYERLIEEELKLRSLKDIVREKRSVISQIHARTPEEAGLIIDTYSHLANTYGVEELFEDLRLFLKKHYQRRKDERKAQKMFEDMLRSEDKNGELERFLTRKYTIASLFSDQDSLERVKSKYGRSVAKFTCYLIKHDCMLEMENEISRALLRVQIALMK